MMPGTPNDDDLVTACWRFVDAMRREDSGQLPPLSPTPLEAYLILAYARSQAGLFRMSHMSFGDAGVAHLFPGVRTMRDVSQTQWDAFSARVGARMAALSAKE